jgi:hypothetical protein
MKKLLFGLFLILLAAVDASAQKSASNYSVAADSGYIKVDGGKLFYEIAGQGENIVLLHDGMVNRDIWDEQFPGSGGKNLLNKPESILFDEAETTISNCDGITVDKYGRCYVTSWPTKSIYRFDKNFSNPPETFRTGTCAPADISYDRVHNALAIPLMLDSKWEIVPIAPPEKQ